MKRILTLLIFILVTACGTQPLALPENDTLAKTVALTLTPTVEPSITPSSTATRTPTPHIRFSYQTPAPTYTPTPTSTSMEIVPPEQSVNGYTFSEARLIPNTLKDYIQIIEWLPDEPNKLLIIRDVVFLEVLNVSTGQTQSYSDGTGRVINPVWLPQQHSVAYLTVNEQDPYTQYLMINDGQNS